MIYREFGKSGIKLSALGFGTMRLPEIQDGDTWRVDDDTACSLIREAYDNGINYFDTAWGYCHYDGQRAVGKAIAPFRDKVYLSTKLPLWSLEDPQDFWKYLMTALERLDTGYIDFYHFHALNRDLWKKVLDLKLLDKMERALSLGLIRHLSFSFHDEPHILKEIADTGMFESLLCQYNLIDRSNEEAMAYAKSKGMGIVVMGPLGGGNIVSGGRDFVSKFTDEDIPASELGLRFVLGNPSVTCALSGMASLDELKENLDIVNRLGSSAQNDWAHLAESTDEIKKLSDLYCTGCGYCEVCPKGIIPASIFKSYNFSKVWGLSKVAASRVTNLGKDGASALPDECMSCRKCAELCPQKIDIPSELTRTWEHLKIYR